MYESNEAFIERRKNIWMHWCTDGLTRVHCITTTLLFYWRYASLWFTIKFLVINASIYLWNALNIWYSSINQIILKINAYNQKICIILAWLNLYLNIIQSKIYLSFNFHICFHIFCWVSVKSYLTEESFAWNYTS